MGRYAFTFSLHTLTSTTGITPGVSKSISTGKLSNICSGIFSAQSLDTSLRSYSVDSLKRYGLSKAFAFFLLLTGIALTSSIETQGQFRKYSNEFLNIGAGARGLAMGGAQTASVSDATSGYWNPAGLTELAGIPSFSLMHAEYFAGIGKYDYGAIALPVGDPESGSRVFGFSLLRFAVDDIPNTLFLVEPDGTLNYNNIHSFSSADYAVMLSYAQTLFEDEQTAFSFGANAKIIHRSVGSFAKAWGFGLDAGLQYRAANFGLGLTAKDITTTFNAWRFSFTDREKEVLYLTNNNIPVKSTEMTAPRLVLGDITRRMFLKVSTSWENSTLT